MPYAERSRRLLEYAEKPKASSRERSRRLLEYADEKPKASSEGRSVPKFD